MNKLKYTSNNWLANKINNSAFLLNKDILQGRVIDLGCGTAPYKEDILKVSDVYIGVDWENSYHKSDQVDVQANLTKRLPFDEEYADTVVSFQVMEHLSEPSFFLSECYRILKQGEIGIYTMPLFWHLHEEPRDYYRYTKYGLKYLFGIESK